MGRRRAPDLQIDQALQLGLVMLQGIGRSASFQGIVGPGDGIFQVAVADLALTGDFYGVEDFIRSAHHASGI